MEVIIHSDIFIQTEQGSGRQDAGQLCAEVTPSTLTVAVTLRCVVCFQAD